MKDHHVGIVITATIHLPFARTAGRGYSLETRFHWLVHYTALRKSQTFPFSIILNDGESLPDTARRGMLFKMSVVYSQLFLSHSSKKYGSQYESFLNNVLKR